MTSFSAPQTYGANPANIQWTVVRGDTSSLLIEFVEDDETTPFNTSTFECSASAYDIRGDVIDELEVEAGDGFVKITAPASITELWGTGYSRTVAELAFDLQVTIDNETI